MGRLTLAAGLALIATAFPVAAQDTVTIYISPAGSDANNGLSAGEPFATPERAEIEIGKRGAGTVYMMGGTFNRKAAIYIPKGAPPQRWSALEKATPVLDGGGQAPDAMRIEADHVSVNGLTIRNFQNNGIVARNAADLTVTGNHISGIASTRWTEAGILVLGSSPRAQITGNDVTDTGYAGIQTFAQATDSAGGTVISGNHISDSCRTKDDCGAIYVNGRSPSSDGAVISQNVINNYGAPSLHRTFGVYLDDFASGAQVTENTISGHGANPVFIHGGRGNHIARNIINVEPDHQALLYGAAGGLRQSDMSGNRFEGNTVHGAQGSASLVKMGAAGKAPPKVEGNRAQR